ncbi:hypothetical protein D9756_010589 [Leucocoprinus leucothites]|uniref:Uncharacterized protein n=1 Tax=Leucocoprinus leucothites TaxID=201217 RepID=A0A8H5CUK5_9AGAR|nr:hypothetical protein D9756_010589 [Leucoagaricus leucothites]
MAAARKLKVEDHTKVVSSMDAGSIGVVKSLNPIYAHVYLLDVFEIVLFPLYLLWKYFKVGDHVCVASRRNIGYVGFITSINKEEFTVTVHDPFHSPLPVTVSITFIQFSVVIPQFRRPPPHDPNVSVVITKMQDPKFDRLEKLSVVFTKDPLKGCFSTVISVPQLGVAQVEMQAISVQTNKLQQVKIQNMVFKLEENEWY